MTVRRQSLRKLFRQQISNVDPLDTALVQQPTARPALGSPSDFVPVHHHICAHRVSKTIVAGIANAALLRYSRHARRPGVTDHGYNSALASRSQGMDQGKMNLLINRHG